MKDKTTEVNCRDCGDIFAEKDIEVLGVILKLGGGRCAKCRKKFIKERASQEEATRAQEIATQRHNWRTGSGIPLKFMTTEFGNFDVDRPGNVKYAYKQCKKYAEGFPLDYHNYIKEKGKAYPSLVLMSPKVWGLGKTHLVSAIGHRILNRWKGEDVAQPVKFITESGLFKKIQATYGYNNEERQHLPSEAAIMRELVYVPLLIIDDIAKEARKDMAFVQRTLFYIINERYNNLRPVILTTNFDTEDLSNYLGGNKPDIWKTAKERDKEQYINQDETIDEAIVDRLLEICGKEYFIKMKGESYRRK